jgi:hypothetical protein
VHEDKVMSSADPLKIFVTLQLCDLATTYWVIRHGGYEANPLVAHLMVLFGVLGALVLTKTGLVLLASRMKMLLPAANAIYLGICLWNGFTIVLLDRRGLS